MPSYAHISENHTSLAALFAEIFYLMLQKSRNVCGEHGQKFSPLPSFFFSGPISTKPATTQ